MHQCNFMLILFSVGDNLSPSKNAPGTINTGGTSFGMIQ
nr:MAG TPA: hypothetical protein [Caudoviricetes sp.]